ncbi:short chain dehydrogenase [Kalymmatonema gypsitolerans NIES-4073]|nr:short chain dehydrogenase [Scytonema sp. NIES-4073]
MQLVVYIGRAIALRCVQEGMKVVLADIEQQALTQTEAEMKALGATVLTVLTDVSKVTDIETLAQKTLDTFGSVHLLCNNAGVTAVASRTWESPLSDWKWVMGVNLWGVIHGVHVFVPIMLEQDTECHIVNTASMAGLTSIAGTGIYSLTKHGVVNLSEILYRELVQMSAKVKVSVLCPGWVNTQLFDSARNRPSEQKNLSPEAEQTSSNSALEQSFHQAMQAGMSSEVVADYLFQGIKDEKFYILTHPEYKVAVKIRLEDILQEPNPTTINLDTKKV